MPTREKLKEFLDVYKYLYPDNKEVLDNMLNDILTFYYSEGEIYRDGVLQAKVYYELEAKWYDNEKAWRDDDSSYWHMRNVTGKAVLKQLEDHGILKISREEETLSTDNGTFIGQTINIPDIELIKLLVKLLGEVKSKEYCSDDFDNTLVKIGSNVAPVLIFDPLRLILLHNGKVVYKLNGRRRTANSFKLLWKYREEKDSQGQIKHEGKLVKYTSLNKFFIPSESSDTLKSNVDADTISDIRRMVYDFKRSFKSKNPPINLDVIEGTGLLLSVTV